ncbi:MAG: hypothetical protein PHC62_00655 [Candidatus Izemoplasmatales bacterium]|nr:hypothetical protein [Candidatus Izemoplasmatales bacterium]
MIYIGTKFYKYEKDKETADVYRLIRYQNKDTVRLRNEETKETFKVSLEDLKKEYVTLSVNGIILFNIVSVGGGKDDVLITLYRDKELHAKAQYPYCVCRQGITDIHAQQYMLQTGKDFYGASVSMDTMPAGVDFGIMVACDAMDETATQIIAIYINDTLDTVLDLIDTVKYDNVLNLLFLEHLQHVSSKFGQMYYKAKLSTGECEGYCNTLRGLLELNDFMFDFKRGYDIYPMDFDFTDCDEKALDVEAMKVLSTLLCKNIDKAMILKYNHDVQLSSIQKDYVLISDKHQNLYVVVYTFSGVYQIPVEAVEDEVGIKVMHKRMNSSSVQSAYNHIMYNKNKFK